MKGWSFTSYERRALMLLTTLILIGAMVRYHHNSKVAKKLEIWQRKAILADSSNIESVKESSDTLIDINSADIRTLERLPGIGPVMAGRIVEWRTQNGPYNTIRDLDKVEGIGDVTIAKIRDRIIVSASQTGAE